MRLLRLGIVQSHQPALHTDGQARALGIPRAAQNAGAHLLLQDLLAIWRPKTKISLWNERMNEKRVDERKKVRIGQ